MNTKEYEEWLANLNFIELMKEWREKLETGPAESSGYTDKSYYKELELLENKINALVHRK